MGILLGTTGVGYLDACDPRFAFLAEVGFALVMFVAGTHVPLRDLALRRRLARPAARAVGVGGAAVLGVVSPRLRHRPRPAVRGTDGVVVGGLVLPIVSRCAWTARPVLAAAAAGRDRGRRLHRGPSARHRPRARRPGRDRGGRRSGRGGLGSSSCGGSIATVSASAPMMSPRSVKFALELRINLAILFAAARRSGCTCRSCWPGSASGSRWPGSASHGGWPGSCSRSPRASSARCSSSGWVRRWIWGARPASGVHRARPGARARGGGGPPEMRVPRQPLAAAGWPAPSWAYRWRPRRSAPTAGAAAGRTGGPDPRCAGHHRRGHDRRRGGGAAPTCQRPPCCGT